MIKEIRFDPENQLRRCFESRAVGSGNDPFGAVLVIAGAGSGKTRTLIYRVAHLVETGIPPEAILLLTFTRKSAQEMLNRASELSDKRCRFVSGGTFHSLAFKVLRNHAGSLGYHNSFTILDRSDMEEVLRTLVPDLKMNEKPARFPKRGTLANIISKASNLQQPIQDLMLNEYGQFMEVAPYIQTLGTLYADYKKTHQLMDYDDLIICFRQLLMENSAVRKELGERYGYVMVDEYQDTNCIQADIVKWLAHDHQTSWWWAMIPSPSIPFEAPISEICLISPKSFPTQK